MAEDSRKQATRVQAGVLKAALADVIGAIEPRNTIPVLAHVLIEAKDGKLRLVGSNLDQWAARDLASNDRDGAASNDWVQSIRAFATTVAAKPLAGILAAIDGEAMVTLELVEEASGGLRLAVSAGRARFKLATLPVSDFPVPAPMAVEHAFELPCSALADAFAKVEMAISSEETRYYLNGIFIHVAQNEGEPQWLVLATTDGHRLARLRLAVPEGAASWPDAILPRAAVTLLDKLLKAAVKGEEKDKESPRVLVEASAGGTSLRFSMAAADGGEIELQTKAIDGTFPDYTRVIPTAPEHSLIVGREALAAAVKRVAVMASDKTRVVRADVSPDLIELVVITPELGEAREEVPCSYDGPAMTFGLNGQYLGEALVSAASDEISLAFTDAIAPTLLRRAGENVDRDVLVQVIMPVRV
jgi:DNA polymerase-3 subunit beta